MRSLCIALALALLAACGDDDGGNPDAAVDFDAAQPPDAEPPDASPPDALPSIGIGLPCADASACGVDQLCIDENLGFPAGGYCSKTCAVDADCGGDAFCSPALDAEGTRLCFLACEADGTCSQAGHVCSEQALGGFLDVGKPVCMYGDASAHDGDACAAFSDCNANSICLNNAFNFPSGYCLTIGCTIGNDATCAPGGDGQCVDIDGPGGDVTACIDKCTAPAQCRQGDGYTCAQLGVGLQACFYPAAKAGDACTTAADCGPAGSPWECLQPADGFTGGYCGNLGCTLDDATTCPLDSICFDRDPQASGDEYCARECSGAGDCRATYICQAVSGTDPRTVCKVE